MQPSGIDILVQIFPLLIFQYTLLPAVVPMARRASPIPAAWIVFALFPVIGGFAYPILLGRSVARILERLDSKP
jgi:hypothetical protein